MNAHTDIDEDAPASDVSADALRILSEMPMPQEHAIAEASQDIEPESDDTPAAQPAQVFTSSGGELDSSGVAWDANIHATGADGKGVRTAKGQWRRRRGVGAARSSVAGVPTRAASPPLDVSAAQARAAGVACAHTMFVMGQALGGVEWAPRQNAEMNEVSMMEKAWGDYFVAKNLTDFPPGLALSIACASYALPRFTMPVTRSRMVRLKSWAAGKWIAWKSRGKPKATKEIGAEDPK